MSPVSKNSLMFGYSWFGKKGDMAGPAQGSGTFESAGAWKKVGVGGVIGEKRDVGVAPMKLALRYRRPIHPAEADSPVPGWNA